MPSALLPPQLRHEFIESRVVHPVPAEFAGGGGVFRQVVDEQAFSFPAERHSMGVLEELRMRLAAPASCETAIASKWASSPGIARGSGRSGPGWCCSPARADTRRLESRDQIGHRRVRPEDIAEGVDELGRACSAAGRLPGRPRNTLRSSPRRIRSDIPGCPNR